MLFWLKLCRVGAPETKIALKDTTLRRRRRELYKKARIRAVQDIMRHTTGSLLFSYWQNFEMKEVTVLDKALRVLGHGSRSFFKHYRDMIPPPDGKKIWDWRPKFIIPERLIPPDTRTARLFGIIESELGRSHSEDLEKLLNMALRMGLQEFRAWALQPLPVFEGETALEWLKQGRSRKVLAELVELQAACAR